MPALGSSAYAVVSDILQTVRVLLNDSQGNVFSDPVLLPFFNLAYNTLWAELENYGDETLKGDEYFLVVPGVSANDPSAQVVIGDTAVVIEQAGNEVAFNNPDEAAPPNVLPADMYRPVKLWERLDGTTFAFVPMVDMTSKGGLPPLGAGTTSLRYWEWREDGIAVLGAQSDIQVRMRYDKMFVDVGDSDASIAIRNGRNFIAFETAGLASRTKNSNRSAELRADAAAAMEQLTTQVLRTQQSRPKRRRPHSSGARYAGW